MTPTLVAIGIVTAVVLVVVLAYAVISMIGSQFAEDDRGTGILKQTARDLHRTRSEEKTLDGGFDRLVKGTLLSLSPEAGGALILIAAALCGIGAYLYNFDELTAGVAAVCGGVVVLAIFYLLRNRRRQAIQEQLPDGCFQIARSLRAGLNLQAALRETTAHSPAPISTLFDRMTVALSLGESTRRSVQRVADQAYVTEFDLFAEVLALNSESGGNLPAMLDRLAASIRDRNQFRGYFRSVTALSRATATFLAAAMPVGLLLYRVLQPEMFQRFIEAREGRILLLAAVILEILGIIWIAYLLRRHDDY